MRNSIEISAELDAKVRELEACQDVAQRKTLADETAALTRELGDAQIEEAARKALANQRVLSPKEKEEIRQFSISKFLREAQHDNLTGVEAEMAKEGEAPPRAAMVTPSRRRSSSPMKGSCVARCSPPAWVSTSSTT